LPEFRHHAGEIVDGGELKNRLQAGRGSWQKRGDRIGVILALVC
jgi:hypothetical protein